MPSAAFEVAYPFGTSPLAIEVITRLRSLPESGISEVCVGPQMDVRSTDEQRLDIKAIGSLLVISVPITGGVRRFNLNCSRRTDLPRLTDLIRTVLSDQPLPAEIIEETETSDEDDPWPVSKPEPKPATPPSVPIKSVKPTLARVGAPIVQPFSKLPPWPGIPNADHLPRPAKRIYTVLQHWYADDGPEVLVEGLLPCLAAINIPESTINEGVTELMSRFLVVWLGPSSLRPQYQRYRIFLGH